MADLITADDLPQSVRDAVEPNVLATMINGANAYAQRVAPCLADKPTADQLAEVKLLLIGAVKRWAEAGSGAFSQNTAGPFSVTTDTRQRGGYNLWPSEITQLQDICKDPSAASGGAFTVDTVPTAGVMHADICSLYFGADYCSCGAELTGAGPLWETEGA